jgi:hypothetical protein
LRADLPGQLPEIVRRVAHGRNDDDERVSRLDPRRDALGDALDAPGVADRRATVLMND